MCYDVGMPAVLIVGHKAEVGARVAAKARAELGSASRSYSVAGVDNLSALARIANEVIAQEGQPNSGNEVFVQASNQLLLANEW
jgi:hypothetical protein